MKPFEQQTYYELLEVPPGASDDEIRAAYDRAMETYAPDSVAVYALEDPSTLDALRARLTEAVEMLTEPDLRIEYDRSLGLPPRAPAQALAAAAGTLSRAELAVVAEGGQVVRVAAGGGVPPGQPFHPAPQAPAEPAPGVAAEPLARTSAGLVAGPGGAWRSAPEPVAPAAPPAPVAAAPTMPPAPAAPAPAHHDGEVGLVQVVRPREVSRPPHPRSLADADEFNGEVLRQAREARGLTVSRLAEKTRISSRHIENVEADRYKELPAQVYLRGMLTSLARELALDPIKVSRSYLALMQSRKS